MRNGCVSEQHLLKVLVGTETFTRAHEQHVATCDACAERFDDVMFGALKTFESAGSAGRESVLSDSSRAESREVEGFLPDTNHLTEDQLLLFYDHGCAHSESEFIIAHLSDCSHCRGSFGEVKRELDDLYQAINDEGNLAGTRSDVTTDVLAHERWQELAATLAPQPNGRANGHATVWQRIVRVVRGRDDAGTRRHGDTGTGRRGDTSTRRRVGFAVACAAGIAIIVFIATHRGVPTLREPFVARRDRRAPAPPQRKPAIEPKTTTNQSTNQPTNNASPKTQNQKPKTEPPARPAAHPSTPLRTSPPTRAPKDVELVQREKVGTFVKVMGAPTIAALGEKDSRPLKPGNFVYTGVRIVTGDADKAELQFNNGTTLRLNFNTTLEIPSEQRSVSSEQSAAAVSPIRPLAHLLTRPSEIKLLLGHLWAKVRKAPDQKFNVETPVATAAVRGTEFGLKVQRIRDEGSGMKKDDPSSLISHPSSLQAVLTVKEGLVEFSNSLGKVEVTAMTETIARPDAKPTEPKRVQTLKVFRIASTQLFFQETSVLTLPEAVERLVFPLGWAGLTVKDAVLPQSVQTDAQLPVSKQVRVVRVRRASPAEKAGIKVGDIITALKGNVISKAAEVDAAIFARPGARLTLSMLRGNHQQTVTLTTKHSTGACSMPRLSRRDARLLSEATWLMIDGKTNEAERALLRLTVHASRITPLVAAAHNNIGVLYETKDEMGKAIGHYEHAAQAEPQVAFYHFNLCLVVCLINDFTIQHAWAIVAACGNHAPL